MFATHLPKRLDNTVYIKAWHSKFVSIEESVWQ